MAREFVLSFGNATVSTTLLWLNNTAAPNISLEILRWWCGWYNATATSNQQRVSIFTQATGFPTMTATTARHLKLADTSPSLLINSTSGTTATCGSQCTTEGGGTVTTVHYDDFNVLNGWLQVPTPPETFVVPASYAQGIGLQFPQVPATQTGWSAGVNFREV